MPQWLCQQLMRAFHSKNRRKVRLLNDCWFFYRDRFPETETNEDRNMVPHDNGTNLPYN
jgi:hypothetical protein